MKTPREHREQIEACDYASEEIAAIEARDSEHRDALRIETEAQDVEIERLKGQLRDADDANEMAAALIERLRGELAEARRFILTLAERNNCGELDCGDPDCDGCVARKFLAAPPPAESTLMQAAPPDDIRERLDDYIHDSRETYAETRRELDAASEWMKKAEARLAALEAKGEPGTPEVCIAFRGYGANPLLCKACGKPAGPPHHPKGAKP